MDLLHNISNNLQQSTTIHNTSNKWRLSLAGVAVRVDSALGMRAFKRLNESFKRLIIVYKVRLSVYKIKR